MRLHLLGINGPFPESRGATSGYLLEAGDNLFQLDLGSGVLGILTSLTAPESLSALFVSHWHYDHTADIPVLMYRLAEEGFVCVLPRMPENLAILSESAASAIPEKVPQIKEWYLAGHSLGGVAASKYIGEHADEYAGMIFCASYTLTDLSESGLRVLSIYGTEDKVMNRGKYAECMSNLPDETETFLIEGGCHSYFGCYGIQEGDGNPTITNEEQIDLVAEEIARWIP